MDRPNSVSVIAEIGVNHNGDIRLARELSEKAFASGADIIKFQTFDPSELTDESAMSAPYQSEVSTSQRDMLAGLSLGREDFRQLAKYVNGSGSEFLTTAFDTNSLRFAIEELGIRRVKIPSGEITNPYLLHFAGKSGLPIILSTGMASNFEIKQAVELILLGRLQLDLKDFIDFNSEKAQESHLDDLVIMHCVSLYPCPLEKMNLAAIDRIRSIVDCEVGLSDHTASLISPALAVAFGATWIEKHITLDKDMIGPDHKASINPLEFKTMVKNIRDAELLIGDTNREISLEEIEMRKYARRGVYAKKGIDSGELVSIEDFRIARPETGLNPTELLVSDLVANGNLVSGSPINANDLTKRNLV